MKRLIPILLLVASCVPAHAQDAKKFFVQQPCAPFPQMFQTVANYGEQMLFTGSGLQFGAQDGQPFTGGSFFFVNQDTGTWSHIMVYGDGMGCMISNGTNFEPYTGTQLPSSQE